MREPMNRHAAAALALALTPMLGMLAAGAPAAGQASSEAARVYALEARVAALAAEAQRIEDINAITRIGRAYGYYLDKGFWNEAADLFAEDGTLEVGVDGVYRGQDRIRQAIIAYGGGGEETGPGLPYGKYYRQMQLQPVVTISEDGQTAHARWRQWSLLGQYEVFAAWGDAEMENVYVKDDGVWKIQAMRVYTNFVVPYQGGWASLQPVEGDWMSDAAKALPADAPPTTTYEPFPAVFVPPYHYDLETPARVADLGGATPHSNQGEGDLGALEAAADEIAARVAIAASERAIENLQGQYGYYIDKGLWTEAAALFAESGTYEFGQSGVYVGRDRVRAAIGLMGPEGLEAGMLNNYPMLQPLITVADDNRTAKARWRSDVMLARNGRGRWGAGVYENEYVNDGGTWRIAKLHYYVTMWADYERGWAQGAALPMDGPSRTLPPDRPPTEVYGSLPEVYLPPYHYVHPVTGEPHPGPGLREEWEP